MAGTNGKDSPDQFQRFSQGSRRGIRTEVKGSILLNLSHNAEGWKLFFNREPEAGIPFVIPQLHIVPGMMLLNEVVLQNQGFLLRMGHDGLDVCHFLNHQGGLRSLLRWLLKIGPNPVSDILCLPHVEDRPFFIFKKIDARVGG